MGFPVPIFHRPVVPADSAQSFQSKPCRQSERSDPVTKLLPGRRIGYPSACHDTDLSFSDNRFLLLLKSSGVLDVDSR